MSLDVSVYLVVGVPLLQLGKIVKSKRAVQLTNRLGVVTGHATLETVYLSTPVSETEIGSNEPAILSNYSSRRISYDFNDLAGEDWVHISDHEGGPEQVVVGCHPRIASLARRKMSRFEAFKAAEMKSIVGAKVKAREYLSDEFGYMGKIYIIAMCHYSY